MDSTSDMLQTCGKRWLTMEQVCQHLGLTKWTIYRLIDRREIPFAAIGKRIYRFDQGKIDEWMETKSVGTIHD